MRLAVHVTVVQYTEGAAVTDKPVVILSVALGKVYSPLFKGTIYSSEESCRYLRLNWLAMFSLAIAKVTQIVLVG